MTSYFPSAIKLLSFLVISIEKLFFSSACFIVFIIFLTLFVNLILILVIICKKMLHMENASKSIGIVLSGGGSKGIAHAGALQF